LPKRRWQSARNTGFPEWLEWGRWLHGWALAELGDIERGVAEMEAGIAGFAPIGGVPRQAFTAVMLAKGYEKLGRIDQAIALLDEQRARIQRTGERLDEAELYRVKGELLDGAGMSRASRACAKRSKSRGGRNRDGGNCAPPRALRDCSRDKGVATRGGRCSPRFTTGSPWASTPRT